MLPFEEFLFWDAKIPGSPADAITHLIFHGTLKREIFERALYIQLKKTLRAYTTIHENENGTIYWETCPDIQEKLRFPLGESFLRWYPESWNSQNSPKQLFPLDITQTPGIRFLVFQDPASDRTDILFHFHHVTTDAIGSFHFLEKLFLSYTQLLHEDIFSEKNTSSPESIPVSMKAPLHFSLLWMITGVLFSWLFSWINPWRKKIWQIPSTQNHLHLNEHPEPTGYLTDRVSQKTFMIPREFRFSKEETEHIRKIAKTYGVTLNDFLLTACFLAAARWKVHMEKNASPATRHSILRAAIPVNLRPSSGEMNTLGNCVSILFLNCTPQECLSENRQKLLKKIAQQMNLMKKTDRRQLVLYGTQGLHDLRRGKKHPRWGMELYLKFRPTLATFVFSNLGILLPCKQLPHTTDGKLCLGNAVLEDIILASPRTTNAGIFFPVGTYAGQLRLFAIYDPSKLRAKDAELWLTFFSEEIRKFISLSSSHSTI